MYQVTNAAGLLQAAFRRTLERASLRCGHAEDSTRTPERKVQTDDHAIIAACVQSLAVSWRNAAKAHAGGAYTEHADGGAH
jgi:hypothetical protein